MHIYTYVHMLIILSMKRIGGPSSIFDRGSLRLDLEGEQPHGCPMAPMAPMARCQPVDSVYGLMRFDTQFYMRNHTCYIYIYLCVCVCVCNIIHIYVHI